MKNKIRMRSLSRKSEHRQALFRNMVTSLIQHERIKTTLPKAKEMKRIGDRVITWAKKGSQQYFVRSMGYVRTKEAVDKLWKTLGPRYSDRAGGYTRVLRAGYRTGDRAPMAVLEFVDRPGEVRPSRPGTARETEAKLAAKRPLSYSQILENRGIKNFSWPPPPAPGAPIVQSPKSRAREMRAQREQQLR